MMTPTFGASRQAQETSPFPANDGKRKQFSGPEDHGIIPATCSRFPPDRTGIWAEKFGNFLEGGG